MSLTPARETLLRTLHDAFQDVAERPPAPRTTGEPYDEDGEAFFAELEEAIAVAPEPPDEAFFDKLAFATKHLTPAAARWYWRANLMDVVAAPWPGDPDTDPETDWPDRLHRAIYALRPSPAGRIDEYSDSAVADLYGWMSPAERGAVSRFLGHVIARQDSLRTGYGYTAAQAIRWAWRDDPESLAAADALHREARSYVRAPAEDASIEAVIAKVERAFANTPRPNEPLIAGGFEEEAGECVVEFTDATWQGLAPWLVDRMSSAYALMTPEAFRYFLPAALCRSLEGADINPESHLVSAIVEPSSYRDEARARAASLTPGERAAVAAYLGRINEYDMSDPDRVTALDEVWDPDGTARLP